MSALLIKNHLIKYPLVAFFAGLSLLALGRLYIYLVSGASAVELTLVVGLPSFLLITGSAVLHQRNWIRFPALLAFLGNASYSIYLAGFAFVNLCAAILFRPLFIGLISPFWLSVGIAVFAILGACLVHVSIERPLLAVTKRQAGFLDKPVGFSPNLAR